MFKKYYILMVLIASTLVSCVRNSNSPGRVYMPDMAYSRAYEAGTENPIFKNGKTNQFAPKGSVAKGKYSYTISNTPEGYEQSVSNTNPFTFSKEEIESEGKHLYTVNCAICHGEKGDGNGYLVQINKFPPPPSYFTTLLDLPEGKKYHTLMYGKNMMGSYATQLDHKERWLVLSYVKSMQDAFRAQNSSKPTETISSTQK